MADVSIGRPTDDVGHTETMTSFIAHYGIWLSIAFVAGLLTGLVSAQNESRDGLLRRADFVPALCILLAVAFTQVIFGRIALYAETAMFTLAAFLAGVGLIIAFVGPISRDHIGWKLGASSVVPIWLAANFASARDVEDELKHRLGSFIERAGGDSLDFEVSGRDVFLPADALGRAALEERLRRAAGVRIVWRVDALSPPAAELRDKAIASAAAARAAREAAEADWARRQAASAAKQKEARTEGKPKSVKEIAEGRSVVRPAVGENAPAAPAALTWKPPLDPTLPRVSAPDSGEATAALVANSRASPCRAALSAAVATEKIRFPVASASPRNGSQPALDRLADLLKRCPEAALEVGGHADSQGAEEVNRALSLRRAQSVVDYLGRLGVEPGRLSSVGYGAERPLIVKDTPVSRAENRRVEFAVK